MRGPLFAIVWRGWLCLALMCAACSASNRAPSAKVVCPEPAKAAEPVPAGSVSSSAAGTWLWSCCDDANTWIGMLVLTQEGNELRGAFLSDGDSHGSYVEGRVDGARVHFARRWRTGSVLHQQFYELVLDARAQQLVGTFTEPAFDPAPHRIRIERGFAAAPRVLSPPAPPLAAEHDALLGEDPKLDPNRPCDCGLVCYCGGVPPGPAHYRESARCGSSCKCRVCPPLP